MITAGAAGSTLRVTKRARFIFMELFLVSAWLTVEGLHESLAQIVDRNTSFCNLRCISQGHLCGRTGGGRKATNLAV